MDLHLKEVGSKARNMKQGEKKEEGGGGGRQTDKQAVRQTDRQAD